MIVTNTTFRAALWADVLFGMDDKWWAQYIDEVRKDFSKVALLVTTTTNSWKYGIKQLTHGAGPFDTFGNSGTGAIAMAIREGARKIVLLGYDCCETNGKKHWHGDHPKQLGNAGSMARWPKQFTRLRNAYPDADIVNCSANTALMMFPRAQLGDVL